MQSSTGRWVIGDDFFDRESELKALEALVHEGNHVLLTGQRRMGKTSIARELGRRLEAKDWTFLFADVEGATCAEEVIAEIAKAGHPVRGMLSSFGNIMRRWIGDNVDEISAGEFAVKIRAGMNNETWRRDGEALLRDCAFCDRRVLLVIDELPIFLKRVLQADGDKRRVDEFLSWLRGVFQSFSNQSPVLMISGSIGLEPLVRRLGIPDRINHLYPFRLAPWTREASVECFECLAKSCDLRIENGVADAAYEKLGIGVPYHVQSFFARLRDFATMRQLGRVTVNDVEEVYQTELLGPSGHNSLVHYETRLKDGLDDESYSIAMELLAEAAIQNVLTVNARRCLERLYASVMCDASGHIADTLEILEYDGYLEKTGEDEYCFPSRLLKDWWAARFRGHHIPIQKRLSVSGK